MDRRSSMIEQMYRIRLDSPFEGAAEQVTKSLADELREIPGVLESSRAKDSESTMDLGTVVEVVVSYGVLQTGSVAIVTFILRSNAIRRPGVSKALLITSTPTPRCASPKSS
jgi:hypothetical protein